ncbi:SDR family oxidoreductase, partial [Alphaproteobacteria bacterium]|nr:SDR family oxidoreductase [Alphaproteobacteria bacterium]
FSNNINIIKIDLSSVNEIKELGSKLKKSKVTHLVNNAGLSIFTHWKDRTEDEFDQVMNVNLKSVFFLSRFFINSCFKNKIKGRIINISSIYGMVSPDQNLYTKFNRRNSEVYGASKAGLIQMTKYFASQYNKTNVLVNAIAPGGILNNKNPQHKDFLKKYSSKCPLNRLANINEIIEPILFLLSTDSEYINGHTLTIDGGLMAL